MKNFNLPEDYRPYIDKYFLRSKEILRREVLNPIITMQVFIRKASGCKLYGIDEAIAIVNKYAPNAEVWALQEGDDIQNCETIMLIKAPAQDIIDLETMYLGVISAETTLQNDKQDINLFDIHQNMHSVVEIASPRPVMYMGARHWRYDRDAEISKECFKAGAKACSTDIGAATVGQEGAGTIPHALEAVYDGIFNKDDAVAFATKAFDDYIDKSVPRIALIDYANREVLDALSVADALGHKLWGVRIDTCGENYMQGVMTPEAFKGIIYENFRDGRGVSITGVYLVRKILDDAGRRDVKIVLSSGFANTEKTRAFVDAEKELNIHLFDMLGIGQVFYSRVATGDIVQVANKEIHKDGRPYRENKRLEKII